MHKPTWPQSQTRQRIDISEALWERSHFCVLAGCGANTLAIVRHRHRSDTEKPVHPADVVYVHEFNGISTSDPFEAAWIIARSPNTLLLTVSQTPAGDRITIPWQLRTPPEKPLVPIENVSEKLIASELAARQVKYSDYGYQWASASKSKKFLDKDGRVRPDLARDSLARKIEESLIARNEASSDELEVEFPITILDFEKTKREDVEASLKETVDRIHDLECVQQETLDRIAVDIDRCNTVLTPEIRDLMEDDRFFDYANALIDDRDENVDTIPSTIDHETLEIFNQPFAELRAKYQTQMEHYDHRYGQNAYYRSFIRYGGSGMKRSVWRQSRRMAQVVQPPLSQKKLSQDEANQQKPKQLKPARVSVGVSFWDIVRLFMPIK